MCICKVTEKSRTAQYCYFPDEARVDCGCVGVRGICKKETVAMGFTI